MDAEASEPPSAAGLVQAFAALGRFPALAEACRQALEASRDGIAGRARLVEAVESDVGLILAVLRAANHDRKEQRRRLDTVETALDALGADGVDRLLRGRVTFEFFARGGAWGAAPNSVRLHALATQRIAVRFAAQISYGPVQRLAVASAVHDIGRLVLAYAQPDYVAALAGARTPSERVQRERVTFGLDHGAVGAALLRRWRFPESIAGVVERHHDCDGGDQAAALVHLADLLAHYEADGLVRVDEIDQAASMLAISPPRLRELVWGVHATAAPRRRCSSPLSPRERQVLQRLAAGRLQKQIALELGLSASAVRSHLHNAYGKLGAGSRAQAVLAAASKGWI